MDAVFPDVSEHNPRLNDTVVKRWRKWSKWVSFRANDGTYQDKNFALNDAWRRHAIRMKWLVGYICYMVWPASESDAGWKESADLYFKILSMNDSNRRRRLVVMIDVESWSKYFHDLSKDLTALWNYSWQRLNSQRPGWQLKTPGLSRFFRMMDRRRVIVYGNAGDLQHIFPTRPKGIRIVLADYSDNAIFPGEVIHQYSSHYHVPGLGFVDVNSADGLSPNQLARKLGLWRILRSL